VSTTNPVSFGTTGGWGKVSGSASAWDVWATMQHPLPTGTGTMGFFEEEPVNNTTEKAMGFISNSNNGNPNTIGAVGSAFEHSWHMYADGTAVPRRLGAVLATPVPYKANDKFRITLSGTQALYSINGIIIATAERVTSVFLYAYSTWKSLNNYFTNVSYLATDANQGSASVSVTGLFPIQPNYTYSYSSDIIMISSAAIDGTEKRRKKSRDRKTLSLDFRERPYFEYQQLMDFWNAHEKHEKFVYRDLVLDESYVMRFETSLGINILGTDSVDIRATLREV
jgi:hypothetical protein